MIDTVAAQGENQMIRNAEAELSVASVGAPRVPIISVCADRTPEPDPADLLVERYVDDGRPVGVEAIAERGGDRLERRRPCAPSSPASRRRAT